MTQYVDFVASRYKWFDDHALNLHHATTGIRGEVDELEVADDRANVMEELGDTGFYVAACKLALNKARTAIGCPIPEDGQFAIPFRAIGYAQCMLAMRWQSGQLLDLTKKHWIYRKPLDIQALDSIERMLHQFHNSWHGMAHIMGWTVDDLRRENQRKLELRYPTAYTDEAAQARADKA